jgi:DNA-binding response OmpR family regulator
MRILVVEDEPALASILVRSLSESGHVATFASGEQITTDVARGLAAGADDYLVKPFALAELEQRLRRLAVER